MSPDLVTIELFSNRAYCTLSGCLLLHNSLVPLPIRRRTSLIVAVIATMLLLALIVPKYIEFNGNERRACIEAGFAPSYATELFRNKKVKARIEKLRPKLERELIRQTEKERLLTRDFLDLQLMHIIANGETHRTRGDADIVKAIEVGYKAIGDIQPMRVVANAQAGAVAAQPATTFIEVYKSGWLIEKEEKMRQQCENEKAERKIPSSLLHHF